MSPESDEQPDEERIFHIARQLSPADRAEYLKQVCSEESRQRIERLIEASKTSTGILKSQAAPQTTEPAPTLRKAGETIGRYKILQKIGEGGFGVVYMAEQTEPVRSKVALKVISGIQRVCNTVAMRISANANPTKSLIRH